MNGFRGEGRRGAQCCLLGVVVCEAAGTVVSALRGRVTRPNEGANRLGPLFALLAVWISTLTFFSLLVLRQAFDFIIARSLAPWCKHHQPCLPFYWTERPSKHGADIYRHDRDRADRDLAQGRAAGRKDHGRYL